MQLNKFQYSVLCILLSVVLIPLFQLLHREHFNFSSSVWCLKGSNQTNICKFKNICYYPRFKTFLFFHNEETIIKGFDDYKQLQMIQLSSVQNHNNFYMNLSIIDMHNFKKFDDFKTYSKVLLFSRFKPNNIMHTIHDDLLPIFLTLEYICLGDLKCIGDYSLVFHDDYPIGPFFNLYALFSKHTPIILSDTNLCFKELVTGLLTDSIVYQYGFNKPHGPVHSKLTQKDLSRFVNFVTNKLKINTNSTSDIVLFNRLKNRKVLNIDTVRDMISKGNKLKIINLNLFKDDIKSLIAYISNSNVLVGMHGAEMIFSLFLKPKSYVFEIFPFGINPDTVSFIKPISKLSGCNFMYFSWRNNLRNNSVAHPNAHPLFGGITHLNQTTQAIIRNITEVPPVKCCNNPLFLYYMYQDTIVSFEFESFFNKSLQQPHKSEMNNKWFYPYKVRNVVCGFKNDKKLLNITWDPPFNVMNGTIKYNLVIRDEKNLFSRNYVTDRAFVQVEIPIGVELRFEIWVLAYFNEFEGPDVYVKCN